MCMPYVSVVNNLFEKEDNKQDNKDNEDAEKNKKGNKDAEKNER